MGYGEILPTTGAFLEHLPAITGYRITKKMVNESSGIREEPQMKKVPAMFTHQEVA